MSFTPQFTVEQKNAINVTNADVLVAAAAGSGKTAVLVERIMRIISDESNPVDIDRLIVVTFTEAAANEMKERISNRISEALASLAETQEGRTSRIYAQLARQNALINYAAITTIHSFCLKLIRANYHNLEIDPGFSIGDETEMLLLKAEVLQELFEHEYAEGGELFANLVESYGDGSFRDDSLQAQVLDLHEFAVSNPYPVNWLEKSAEAFRPKDGGSVDAIKWTSILLDVFKREMNAAKSALCEALDICLLPEGPVKYLPAIQNDIGIVDGLLTAASFGYEELYAACCETKFQNLAQYRNKDGVDENLIERVKGIRNDEFKKIYSKLKESLFYKPPQDLYADAENLYPIIVGLKNLAISFMERFKTAKLAKNIMDFNDLEHYCLSLLVQNGEPTETARELREYYHEILIDEYQDSNELQELLLSMISKPNAPNRFMVGDIKQSIYKFRSAQPEIFLNKYNSFIKYDENNARTHVRIDLSKNFRSRDCVIHSVNMVFKALMSHELGDIEYDDGAMLYAGADYPVTGQNISTVSELLLCDFISEKEDSEIFANEISEETNDNNTKDMVDAGSELTKKEAEAEMIAERIIALIEADKLTVWDKEISAYRPLEYKDIVILIRGGLKSSGEMFAQVFAKHNIPLYVSLSTGFYDTIEVMTMLSLLQIVDNPLQDLHIITVLHSAIYCFTADELYEIREKGTGRFYICIKEYIKDGGALTARLESFCADLDRWRRDAVTMPIGSLVYRMLHETGYYSFAGAMKGGAVKCANLRSLVEKAEEYEKTSFKSLFNFNKYIERIKKREGDDGEAGGFGENDNIVRMMSVHKSKGLEFPVVFVSQLGNNFNAQDERKKNILHQELGFGPMYVDLDNRIKSDTLPRIALSYQISQENLSEELRLLYVAMTRAKEKLILTGSLKNLDASLSKWSKLRNSGSERLPASYLFNSKCFLDWVCPCIDFDGDRLFKVTIIKREKIAAADRSLEIKEEPADVFFEYISGQAINLTELDNMLGRSYQYKDTVKTPMKLSISELKRLYHKETDTDGARLTAYNANEYTLPDFIIKARSLNKSQIGTAVHTVMEHIHFNEQYDRNKLDILIDQLVRDNILTGQESAAIPREKIIRFTQSDLARRIQHSPRVYRERQFVMGVDSEEVYLNNISSNDEKILIHGIIDCCFYENDEIVLVDYKSDYVTRENVPELAGKYRLQMELYKRALESGEGVRVKQCVLYLFALDDYVDCDRFVE